MSREEKTVQNMWVFFMVRSGTDRYTFNNGDTPRCHRFSRDVQQDKKGKGKL